MALNASSPDRISVVFFARALTHYRVGFHEGVRRSLADADVHYRLFHSRGRPEEERKNDLVTLDWAEPIPALYFGPMGKLVWQSGISQLGKAKLVVIGQENSLLANYPLLLGRKFGGPKVAFFGHGRGYQATNPDGRSERFKRFWANKVDWWFPYTESGARAVEATGFPADRITVFNNAIDTSAISRMLAAIDDSEVNELRQRLVGGSQHVGVYVGGIYAEKRIPFLIDSAEAIRQRIPDFHLLVIGDGPDAGLVQQAAAKHSWIHPLGPKFGREKSMLVRLGRAFLMPGLVGLAVLDAFAYGTPMITTNLPYHSPEFDYLRSGENGIVVANPEDSDAYAEAVVSVLLDDQLRSRLNAAAAHDAQFYTIENMANRFSEGILQALRSI